MEDVSEERFEEAAEEVQNLPERPEQDDLLKLYAHYKQGTEGDVTGDRPGMLSFRKRAKYDAWAELEGMDEQEAQNKYVQIVERLKDEQGV